MSFKSRIGPEKAIEAANRDTGWRARLTGWTDRISTRGWIISAVVLVLVVWLAVDMTSKRRTIAAAKEVAAYVRREKAEEQPAPQPKLTHKLPPAAPVVIALTPQQKVQAAIAKLDSLRTSGDPAQRRYADSIIFANFGRTETVTVAAAPKPKKTQRKLAFDLRKVNASNLQPGVHSLGEGRVVVVPK